MSLFKRATPLNTHFAGIPLPSFDIYDTFANLIPDDIDLGTVTERTLRARKKVWGWEILFAHTPAYTGKLLYRRGDPDYAGNVQFHPDRAETFIVIVGECLVRWDEGDGVLKVEKVGPGRSFHVPVGARHSIIALTDCVFAEVSTPAFGQAISVDKEYR